MGLQKLESNEKTLLTPEQVAILGTELSECLTLLHDQLAPYEEWAKGGDFTTTELLQVLKEDGIFRDLKIIQSMGKAVQARYAQMTAEVKKRYGGNPPERARAQSLQKMTDIIVALVNREQPLMKEILNQTLDAGQAEMFLTVADGIRSRRAPGMNEEMRIKRVLEAENKPLRVRNYSDILVLLARCRETTLELKRFHPQKEADAEEAFKTYRWAEMELARPGVMPEFNFGGIDGKAMDFKVAVYPTKLGEKAMFEAFGIRISFSVDVPHPTLKGFQTKVPIQLNLGLSRVHPEITPFANGYVSLEPFFEAYGLPGFYNRLKKELWLQVKSAVELGYFRIKESIKEEAKPALETTQTEPSAGLEAVSKNTQGAVADTMEQSQEKRTKIVKGLRATTRNIPIEDVLGTLDKLGISASRQNGTSHLILKGRNAETQRPATWTIPVASIGDNSGPYIAQAARVFGFTRKDFLTALSEL